MAARYWVGGTANWDATAGTKWATTSGGAGGAAVPTSADDVYFDAASGVVTVTVTATANCLNLTCTGFTGTITGSSTLNIYGNCTLVAGMTWSHSGVVSFAASSGSYTITSAGKTFNANAQLGLAGAGAATWVLADAMSVTGTLTHNNGTFTTNNYAVTASSLSSSNSNTRTINLGSSTVTLSGTGSVINFTNSTNLTLNAGTSSVVLTGAGATIIPGIGASSVTFNNLAFTSTTASTHLINVGGVGVLTALVVNDLSVAAPAAAGVTQFAFAQGCTINGTLSTTGTAGNRRVWFRSNTYGIAQTLTINSAPSLTDADFRDIYVIGTAAPISGTRIGDLRGCRGITFSTPKTVYWNLAAGGNWSDNAWAATSGGGVSTDNFPLAQDTAVIENTGLNVSAQIQTPLSSTPFAVSTLNASTRTLAMTINFNTSTYYGDFILGSGVSMIGASVATFSGRNTQTITSAGKTFSGGITIDSYGGTVQLADALNIGSSALTVTNGTFNTQNYNVTAGSLSSSNSNVRAINLGSSTVTLSSSGSIVGATTTTNLAFTAGTSTIIGISNGGISTAGLTFYNVNLTSTTANSEITVTGANTYNNLSITAPSTAGLRTITFFANQTINGTLTVAGATAVRRIFLRSDTLGTQRDLTVGTLVANDCDFRDIEILGAAIGTAPTRAGDCGGNNNITFPSPKTVYWNLAGTQNWSATGWASSSGGTPDINNFPLAQDTAVFDDAGAAGTVSLQAFNTSSVNASARASAITLNWAVVPIIYGSWTNSAAVTITGTGTLIFSGRGVQTITGAGVAFTQNITIDCFSGTVQLADALTLNSARTLTLTSGTFDAVTYNVTTGSFSALSTSATLKMGSGTWTLSGVGTVWTINTSLVFYKGVADIVLSNTSTSARTFNANGLSYNKLTIGGATGTSTLDISGGGQFTELAATKTVAHTISLAASSLTLGKWSVTGTAGNVVTVTGTATITIAGARVSGVDYLAMGTTAVSATSPGEFYAGVNSTGTGSGVLLTIAQPASTYYWVGGSGTWNATSRTNWAITSGGAAGVYGPPTSADHVVFDSASNATAYTVTCTATQLRCGSLTISGPASGNVTWAGTAPLAIHGDVSLAATGITRTYNGGITLSGSSTGRTFTTNGVALSSSITVNGVGCGWVLGAALNIQTGSQITVVNGALDTANYAVIAQTISAGSVANTRSISLGSSVLTLSGSNPVDFLVPSAFSFSAGTSTINCSGVGAISAFSGGGNTFYNVATTGAGGPTTFTMSGGNTFNNLTFAGRTSAGITPIIFSANQTINGTLTLSPGASATMRTFVQSNTIGTTRTLTCAAVTATDIDFRDITIAGAAAPVSGTRLGDCKGNSGITFDAAKTVYWRATPAGDNWGTDSWSLTLGGAYTLTAFPLAQDTAVFANYPNTGQTVTINAAYNIGTIDMSARTSNTMTLATGTTTPTIYGNWINGTGTTLTGTGTLTFAGRGSQTITSAGKTFTQPFTVNTPSGAVTLQDATTLSGNIVLTAGTFDANNYNVTAPLVSSSSANTRTLAIGSGTWTLSAASIPWTTTSSLIVTGTGTISLTSASTKTFAGSGISYSGITLDQGGAGTLTITGNNTFANISNSYKATGATNITLGTTTQTVGNFTASGEAGRVLTVQGTSASSPATLIFSGAGQATQPTTDYLTITGVRAYSLDTTWYAGANSTNNGSLGWYFEAGGGGPIAVYITESTTASDAASTIATLNISVSESITATEAASAGMVYLGALAESATAADVVEAVKAYLAAVSEATTASELTSASLTLTATLSELTTAAESLAVRSVLTAPVSEVTSAADSIAGGLLFLSDVTEAATATDVAESVLIFNRAVTEATTVAEVLVAVATFQAAVPEQVVGADVARALTQISGSVNEALTALDESIASNQITANVGSLPQDMALLPVGTSAAGSLVFDSSSFIDGAAVFADGTGTGSTGGFDLGGNYLGFAYAGPALYAEAISTIFSWTNVVGIRVDLIAGTATNGGPVPNGDMSVSLVTTAGPYTVYDTLALITKDAADTLISVMIPVSAYYRVASGRLSFQPNSPAPTTTPSWAVKSFTIYYGGAGAQDTTTTTRITYPAIAEAVQVADVAQVVASTFSAAASDTAQALDTPQGANTGTSALSEAATASETTSTKFNPSTSVSEQAAGQETAAAKAMLRGPIAETAAATDQSSVAPSVFSAIATAAAAVFEVPNPAGSVYNAALPVESAGITDSFIGAYLWNLINDAQTPNWATVQTPQDPGWTTIDDTQNPGWHNINIT